MTMTGVASSGSDGIMSPYLLICLFCSLLSIFLSLYKILRPPSSIFLLLLLPLLKLITVAEILTSKKNQLQISIVLYLKVSRLRRVADYEHTSSRGFPCPCSTLQPTSPRLPRSNRCLSPALLLVNPSHFLSHDEGEDGWGGGEGRRDWPEGEEGGVGGKGDKGRMSPGKR